MAEISWKFDPPRVGNALCEGGWAVGYPLGEVTATPEFSFPLQLVSLNGREDLGLFGKGWFCPQLDSRVIPRENGVFVWQMPSGAAIGFQQDRKDARIFRSVSGDWQARVVGLAQEIWNEAGWRFRYERSRLVAVTSPSGRSLNFIWTAKRLQEIRLSAGLAGQAANAGGMMILRAAYVEGDDRVRSLEVQGQTSRFDYSPANGRLAMWTPPAGPRLAFGYSKEGVLAWTQVEKGVREEFRTEFVAPGKGEPADRGKLANWWLQKDANFAYVYGKDKRGTPQQTQITITDRAGRTRSVSQLNGGMQTNETVDGVPRETFYYRAPGQKYDGRLRMIREGEKTLVEYRYDRKSGLLTESTDQDGLITFYDYPPGAAKGGFVPGQPGAAARLGKPIRIRQGSRKQSDVIAEYSYDDFGRPIASRDRAGKVVKVTYTQRGEIASIEESGSGLTRFTYDVFGRRVGVERNGARESVTYDDRGRIVARQEADGSKSEFTYDARGQIAQAKRNGQMLTEYLRDPLGRVVGEKDPLGRVKTCERDDRGNLLAEHAPNGSVTRYEYDALNQRVAQIDGNGNRIRFDYDLAGHLIRQTNPLGDTLGWIYDAQGRLVARTNGVQTIAYLYDEGKRLRRIDYTAPGSAAIPPPPAAAAPSAPVASYFGTTDPDGGASPDGAAPPAPAAPAARENAASQTIDYTYDAQGRMLTAETPATRFEYLRDKLGRVEALSCVERGPDGKDAREQLLRYRYDAAGRRTGLLLAELRPAVPARGGQAGHEAEYETLQQTEYTYDGAGRLAAILDNGAVAVSYRYDAAGRLAGKTFGNGVQTTISYDSMGRLAKMVFSGGPLAEPKVLEYTWDVASQVTRRSWNGEPSGEGRREIDPVKAGAGGPATGQVAGQTQCYEYDPSGQLLKVIDAATNEVLEAYAYDKAGNMLEKTINGEKTTMTYNAANELATRTVDSSENPKSKIQNLKYAYDRAGRMLGYEGGPQSTYGWLDKVTELKLSGGQKIAYAYWPDGQLATKEAQPTDTKDAKGIQRVSNSLSTIDSQPSTAAKEHFLWDGLALLRRNDTVYLIEPHPSGGVPIASHPVGTAREAGDITYYLNDLLGTTLATIEGQSTEYVKLTTFGQPLKMLPPPSAPSSTNAASTPAPGVPPAPAQSLHVN